MEFHPLTPQRWDDFEALFGPRGAYAGCWCMWWRLKRAEFERGQGEANRLAMKAIVEAYPTVARSGTAPPTSSYMGFPEVFERVGFVEVAQPSASKRIVRYVIPTR